MQGTILLSYGENTKQVEQEERIRFLKSLLEQMGVPISDFWESDDPLSIDQRIKLREILMSYSIQVVDDNDGGMEIYVENEKVAEYYRPTYKLKRDYSKIDPRKQLFLEMTIDYNSVFEEGE
jgi:hypothetical protein